MLELTDLVDDSIVQIIEHLDDRSHCALATTCSRIYELSRDRLHRTPYHQPIEPLDEPYPSVSRFYVRAIKWGHYNTLPWTPWAVLDGPRLKGLVALGLIDAAELRCSLLPAADRAKEVFELDAADPGSISRSGTALDNYPLEPTKRFIGWLITNYDLRLPSGILGSEYNWTRNILCYIAMHEELIKLLPDPVGSCRRALTVERYPSSRYVFATALLMSNYRLVVRLLGPEIRELLDGMSYEASPVLTNCFIVDVSPERLEFLRFLAGQNILRFNIYDIVAICWATDEPDAFLDFFLAHIDCMAIIIRSRKENPLPIRRQIKALAIGGQLSLRRYQNFRRALTVFGKILQKSNSWRPDIPGYFARSVLRYVEEYVQDSVVFDNRHLPLLRYLVDKGAWRTTLDRMLTFFRKRRYPRPRDAPFLQLLFRGPEGMTALAKVMTHVREHPDTGLTPERIVSFVQAADLSKVVKEFLSR